MNVGELKELLDDYGDHLPVVIENVDDMKVYPYSLGSGTVDGEHCVILDISPDQ